MSSKENADYLMRKALEAGISNPKELANFMGQMQIECGGFSRMSENLNYSGKRLFEVFSGRNGMDTIDEANTIAVRGPEAVANTIYGGTWGKKNLGNTEQGDGWSFHGRGYVQLTGRANYESTGKELGLDLVSHPELAEDREIAAEIAIRYWKVRVVANGHQEDVRNATHDINGGENHLAERRAAVKVWEEKLRLGYIDKNISSGTRQVDDGRARATSMNNVASLGNETSLKQGRREQSAEIREIQTRLNALGYRDEHGHILDVDGDFGARTRKAVLDFQQASGLKADGIVGTHTLEALKKAEHAPLLSNPNHPIHAFYKQALAGVERLPLESFRNDQERRNAAASLAVDAKISGLTKIDHVLMSAHGLSLFAVQGRIDDPAHNRAHVDKAQAAAQPIERSTAQMDEERRDQQQQQRIFEHDPRRIMI